MIITVETTPDACHRLHCFRMQDGWISYVLSSARVVRVGQCRSRSRSRWVIVTSTSTKVRETFRARVSFRWSELHCGVCEGRHWSQCALPPPFYPTLFRILLFPLIAFLTQRVFGAEIPVESVDAAR